MTYTFQRGETLALALDVVSGSFASVTGVTAALKPLAAGRTIVDASAPATTLSVAANGTGGWTLTLSATACAALVPGSYVADARLAVGSGIVITEPVAVRIVEGVTS
jgi:hypothetical protein